MSTLSALLGNLLSLPEPGARFLLALFSAYPIAFFYRVLVAERSSDFKNIYFTLTGLWVLYYVYGVTLWHSVVDVLAVYLVLWLCGGSLLSVSLTWIITMSHLVCGYVYVVYTSQVHPISWTIPHCVLVLKLVGVAYNIYDGRKKPEMVSEEMKRLAVDEMPSFLDVTGFVYFVSSELVGPQIPFSRHLKFTKGHLFDWKTTPSSIPAGVQRLLIGIFYAILYSFLNQFFPISFLVSDQFMFLFCSLVGVLLGWKIPNTHVTVKDFEKLHTIFVLFLSIGIMTVGEMGFAMRLVFLVMCGKVALWRYICVWLIAEGSCIITGISYEHKKSDHEAGEGSVGWHALTNVNVIDFETSIHLEAMVESFNLNTNRWMSWYVFKRLKFLGNKVLSWFLTVLFLSLWHGVWPGYYITFTLEMLLVMAERKLITFYRRLFKCPLADLYLPIRLPLTLVAYLVKNCFLMYPIATFMLLQWSLCYQFMYSMYFFCHVVAIGWMILYPILMSLFVKVAKKASNAVKTE